MMCWGGTEESCAICKLDCVGKISEEANKKYTTTLMDKISGDLGIQKDR